MKLKKLIIFNIGMLLWPVVSMSALIGDSVEGNISTTSTISYVATQFNSPAVVDNTGTPEFTGNFHYAYNTTGGQEVYEFDVMFDVGDTYFEFWMQPTNDWGGVGSFSTTGTIFTIGIGDIDTGGPISDVYFDPYYDSQYMDEFGIPEAQWDPTLGNVSWNDYTVWFPIHGSTNSGEHFRYYFESASVVPIPAAIWLFGSGILGLIGISRYKKQA